MGFWKSSLEDLVMSTQFWKDKTILLTGHTGFKGSWLSLWLQKLGANLIGFSKSIPTEPSLFEIANVKEEMTSVIGNVCNYSKLSDIITDYKPEIVIHMAAQAILRESYKDPIETYATNVMGTVNLLESIRNSNSVRVILNITSDKCYEPKKFPEDYKEDDPMGGYDPYSSSKGCSELVTSSFRNSFFNPKEFVKHKVALASARAGNVIGGGDWGLDRLIPDIMRGIFDNKPIRIRNPNATRPWQHVLEPLNGYLLLIEKMWTDGPEFSEGWNFGPSETNSKSVKWIVEKISQKWNQKISWIIDDNKNPHEENYLGLDCSKIRSKLGWTSKMNLDKGISLTIDWYKQYEQKNDMKKVTEKQIDDFISLS